MDGRPISRFEFHPQFLSLYYPANPPRTRYAIVSLFGLLKKERKRERKKKEIDYHSLELIELPTARIEFRAKMRDEAIFAAARCFTALNADSRT